MVRGWTVAFQTRENMTILSGLYAAPVTRDDAVRESGEMSLVNYKNGGDLRYFAAALPVVLAE